MEILDKIKQPLQPSTPSHETEDPDTEQISRIETAESLQKKKQAELEEELEEKRKRRDFSEEGWFYRIRVGALWTTSTLSLSAIAVYWWHLLGPTCWHWLQDESLDRIERMATTIIVGIVGTLSAGFFLKKH